MNELDRLNVQFSNKLQQTENARYILAKECMDKDNKIRDLNLKQKIEAKKIEDLKS